MLRGSGIRTADQVNFFQREFAGLPEARAKVQIQEKVTAFAQKHPIIMVKAEKESGGRRSRVLPVRHDKALLENNIRSLVEFIYEITQTDNAAVQELLRSHVHQLYDKAFLREVVDRFAKVGIPVVLDRSPQTPLFSYFRIIVIRGVQGYEISHYMTVISTQSVANVGQGGLLFEYRDEIIDERYREDLRREITLAVRQSIESQRRYLRTHWREVLAEYLEAYPEFQGKVNVKPEQDWTGFSNLDIPYEMGDYMPVFLVDARDNLQWIYDREREELQPLFNEGGCPTDIQIFDESGRRLPRTDSGGNPVPIPMFDEKGHRLRRYDARGNEIGTLVVYKIESNPGAGLWRPHNDQLPPPRKGEGVCMIFERLGERARLYKQKLVEGPA